MHTTTWRRRIAAILALPLLILLAGCGTFTADVEIKDEQTLNVHLDLAVKQELAQSTYSSAEEFCKADQTFGASPAQAKPEPYEKDGMWGCKIAGTLKPSDFNGDMQLTKADGEYHLVLGGMEEMGGSADMTGMEGFEMHVTFTFPGEVTASKGGTIDGKTVTYTDLNDIAQGIDIRAEAGGGGIVWVILGIIALLLLLLVVIVIAVVIFLVVRRRKKNAALAGGGPGAANSAVPAPGGYASPAAPGSAASPSPGTSQGWNQQGGPSDAQQPWNQQGGPSDAQQPWNQQGSQPDGQQGWNQQGGQPDGQQPWNQQPGDGQQPPYRGPQG